MGEVYFVVESNILLFMNHGCNGTYNYGSDFSGDDSWKPITEMDAVSLTKDCADDYLYYAPAYSPVFERHLRQSSKSGDVTLRDIKKGEEILTDYLEFSGDVEGFIEDAVT